MISPEEARIARADNGMLTARDAFEDAIDTALCTYTDKARVKIPIPKNPLHAVWLSQVAERLVVLYKERGWDVEIVTNALEGDYLRFTL